MVSFLQKYSCKAVAVYIIIVNFIAAGLPLFIHANTSSQSLYEPSVLGASTSVPAILIPKQISEPATAAVTAKSFLVYDPVSKTVMVHKNSDQQLPVASISKLVIAYLVAQHGELADTVTITPADMFTVHPILGLVVGDQVLVRDLLYSMLVGSANDAAVTLTHYLENKTGQEIESLLVETVDRLGMGSSQFKDPIGFDNITTYTTADDLTLVVNALLDTQLLDEVSRMVSYSFNSTLGKNYAVQATNKLIEKDQELYAIKTGYTNKARGSMISRVVHEGQSFVIIVLGSTDREADTALLKQEVIAHFEW